MIDNVAESHAVLGVRKNASAKTIRRAYRKLAMEYHPDRNVGNEEAAARFKAIHRAYAKLTGKYIEPDNSAVFAYNCLAQIFAIVVQQCAAKSVSPKCLDVKKAMRKVLEQQMENVRDSIASLGKIETTLMEITGRFYGKEAESMEAMIEHDLIGAQRSRQKAQESLRVMEAAKRLLDAVSYRFEEPPQSSPRILGCIWEIRQL